MDGCIGQKNGAGVSASKKKTNKKTVWQGQTIAHFCSFNMTSILHMQQKVKKVECSVVVVINDCKDFRF